MIAHVRPSGRGSSLFSLNMQQFISILVFCLAFATMGDGDGYEYDPATTTSSNRSPTTAVSSGDAHEDEESSSSSSSTDNDDGDDDHDTEASSDPYTDGLMEVQTDAVVKTEVKSELDEMMTKTMKKQSSWRRRL